MIETKRDSIRAKLLEVFRHSGQPMATIYLPSVPTDLDGNAVEDAAHRQDIRVGNVLKELAEIGVTDDFESAIADALASHDHGASDVLVLVATPSEVLLSFDTHRPIARTVCAVGRTPELLPLLMAAQADIEHLAVLLDRTGADVWLRDGTPDPLDSMSVDGDNRRDHPSHTVGESQQRLQPITENAWERNAKDVVDAVLDAAPSAEVVVAGGGDHPVGFFAEHMPAGPRTLITVEGSRAADHATFLDNVDTAIRSLAAEQLVDDLQRLRDAMIAGRAVQGSDVLGLLSQNRIDRLYVANDTFDVHRPVATFDFSPPSPATAASEASADAIRTTAPITEGAVALAVASGADVVVVPGAGAVGTDMPIAGIMRGERV